MKENINHMEKLTLITTVYKLEPVMAAVTKISPTKIVLLREEDAPEEKIRTENMIKEIFGKILKVDVKITSMYDLLEIAKDTVDVIEMENAKKSRVIINVTGGRKTQFMGALFGAYARKEMVEKVIYITEEDNEVIELPLLHFGLSKTKKRILEKIKKGEVSVRNIAKLVGISRGMTYNHIRELKEGGFLGDSKEGLKITTAGKLAIL
jgi:CRISPR-associated protein Csa3